MSQQLQQQRKGSKETRMHIVNQGLCVIENAVVALSTSSAADTAGGVVGVPTTWLQESNNLCSTIINLAKESSLPKFSARLAEVLHICRVWQSDTSFAICFIISAYYMLLS
jgi:hypothetical protein